MNRTLHDHQELAMSKLRLSLKTGHRRPMLQAPTGFGKTVVAGAIIDCALKKGNPVIMTVPAIDLIDQSVISLADEGILDVGVIQGKHPLWNPQAPVQVASVQTLCRRQIPKATLVLVDEAHKWFDFYGTWMNRPEWEKVPFVGLSATPWTRGLGKHYDDLIIAETTQGLIDKGFLSKFRVFAPAVKPELDGMRTLAGDYHEAQLSTEMRKSKLVADCVVQWLAKGENLPTLCFAVDRAHAKDLRDAFEKRGIPTAYIDAYTSRNDRNDIRLRSKCGLIKVIVNVGCMTTGTDMPWISCIILARPTKSEILFTQIIGRGLRTDEGKADCLILDHSDTTARLGFVTDIHHETLDDGTLKRSKTERQQRAKSELPVECGRCGMLLKPNCRKCSHCGYEPRRPSTVHHADGELVQISGKVLKADKGMKQKWYSMLCQIGDERGYKPGWAARKYQEKFEVWPRNLSEIRMTPDAEVRNWVLSRNIAWAKGRNNAERRVAA